MSVSDSLQYDFNYKNEILSGCFDEVNPFTFYETGRYRKKSRTKLLGL